MSILFFPGNLIFLKEVYENTYADEKKHLSVCLYNFRKQDQQISENQRQKPEHPDILPHTVAKKPAAESK